MRSSCSIAAALLLLLFPDISSNCKMVFSQMLVSKGRNPIVLVIISIHSCQKGIMVSIRIQLALYFIHESFFLLKYVLGMLSISVESL